MASTLQKFSDAEFQTIYCTRLVVRPKTTPLKWSNAHKNENVELLGSLDIAKGPSLAGEQGVLGATGYVIGTDGDKWIIDPFIEGTIYVGMAVVGQDLGTTIGVAVNKSIPAIEGDQLTFLLSTNSKLTITHTAGGKNTMSVYDLSQFNGQQLYPWLSSSDGRSFSGRIRADLDFVTTVDPDGKSRMTALGNDIVDFSVTDITDNDVAGGGSGAPPGAPPGGGGSSIENGGGAVVVDAAGDIFLDGGTSYKCKILRRQRQLL